MSDVSNISMKLLSGLLRSHVIMGLGSAMTVQTRVTFVSTSLVIFAGDFATICGGPGQLLK